jgi:hypothetical protein
MSVVFNSSLALCVAAILLGGCATPPHYENPNGTGTVLNVTEINQQDLNIAVEDLITKIQNEFINRGNLECADGPGKPSILAISRIVNNTSKQVKGRNYCLVIGVERDLFGAAATPKSFAS